MGIRVAFIVGISATLAAGASARESRQAASSARHVAPNGVLVAMKGVHPDEELAQLPAGFTVLAAPAIDVPGLDAARHLIVLQPPPSA